MANVILNSNDQLTTTFTSPNEEGELVFKLTVFDNDFSSDVDTVVITIINTNTFQTLKRYYNKRKCAVNTQTLL